MVSGCKIIHKPGKTFFGFLRIFMELYRSKVQLAPPHRNFINGVANPEIVYTESLSKLSSGLSNVFLIATATDNYLVTSLLKLCCWVPILEFKEFTFKYIIATKVIFSTFFCSETWFIY